MSVSAKWGLVSCLTAVLWTAAVEDFCSRVYPVGRRVVLETNV